MRLYLNHILAILLLVWISGCILYFKLLDFNFSYYPENHQKTPELEIQLSIFKVRIRTQKEAIQQLEEIIRENEKLIAKLNHSIQSYCKFDIQRAAFLLYLK